MLGPKLDWQKKERNKLRPVLFQCHSIMSECCPCGGGKEFKGTFLNSRKTEDKGRLEVTGKTKRTSGIGGLVWDLGGVAQCG